MLTRYDKPQPKITRYSWDLYKPRNIARSPQLVTLCLSKLEKKNKILSLAMARWAVSHFRTSELIFPMSLTVLSSSEFWISGELTVRLVVYKPPHWKVELPSTSKEATNVSWDPEDHISDGWSPYEVDENVDYMYYIPIIHSQEIIPIGSQILKHQDWIMFNRATDTFTNHPFQ